MNSPLPAPGSTITGSTTAELADAQIGMDIGGTKTAGLVLDRDGRIEAEVTVRTPSGIDGVLDTAAEVVAMLAERTGRTVHDFASIGVGVPGQVDRAEGYLRYAYNIGIEQIDLAAQIEKRTGIPVSIDNDVTAAAIGAVHLMQLGGTVAYLNLGTGLAAGYVVDGLPIRGETGVAGEIGHLPIDPLGRPCPCGQFGCLETVASGSGLKTYWPAGGDHPGRVLLAAIEAGDADAKFALDHLVEGAASAIRVLGFTLDPGTLVIGGGLRLVGDPVIEGIRSTLQRWENDSPFFAQLKMSERIQVLPEDSPAAAVGAAIASRS